MDPSGELSADSIADCDDTALVALVRQHQSFVFRICLKFLRHRHDAEDATQETFSRVAKYLHRFDRKRPVKPWLATIAGNHCRTLLAKQKSAPWHARHSLAEVQQLPQTRLLDGDDARQLREEIALALDSLPQAQKEAFELFHQRGLSYQQISVQLDRPLGTVKTWVHRARVRLMDRLRDRDAITPPPKSFPKSFPKFFPGAPR